MHLQQWFAVASTISIASARIVGFAAPGVVKPDSEIEVRFISQNYIQRVADVAVAFGWSPTPGFPGTIGRSETTSAYIGPDKSNLGSTNVTISTKVPDWVDDIAQDGKVVLGAGVYSIYGVSGTPTVMVLNVTVEIGDETSADYVDTLDFCWNNSGSCVPT